MKQFSQLIQAAFIVVAAVAVYSFVTAARDGERRRLCAPLCHLRPNYAAKDRSAPDFERPSTGPAGERPLRLSQYKGKVVVLNFWTKNCRPCLEEMPSLAELTASLAKDPDVAVVTVSTDDSLDDVRATLKSVLGGAPPFVVGVDPDSDVVAGKYGTKLYPETWLIDRKGVIRARFDGARDWTSPLVHDLIDELKEPLSCSVEMENGRATGEDATTCEDIEG
jgi:thiol-disulfide isomerase/thioredoxin